MASLTTVRPAPVAPPREVARWSLPPWWPLGALIALYPLWWVLGLAPFVAIIFAVPMAFQLSHRRPLVVPPFFGAWVLFLLWMLVSVVMMDLTAPGTLEPGGGLGRYMAFALRALNYLAVTVVLLYVGNMRHVLARITVIRMLCALFIATLIGGLVGTFFPTISFDSPMELLMPSALTSNDFVARLMHVEVAQVQNILGYESPRPSAPFEYTNTWGTNLSMLMVWFMVGWWTYGKRWQRLAVPVVLGLAVIPVVSSLNRGLWIGLALSLAYALFRLGLLGKVVPLLVMLVGVAVLAVGLTVTSAGSTATGRVEAGHSDEVRSSLAEHSWTAAKSSPLLGYGSTRSTIGSERSIAIGKTDECKTCGNRIVGSTGQLWLLLIAQGLVGTALYFAFFLVSLWRSRADHSPIGIAGSLVLLLSLVYACLYPALTTPLIITMVSVALLWRNDMARREAAASVGAGAPSRPGVTTA